MLLQAAAAALMAATSGCPRAGRAYRATGSTAAGMASATPNNDKRHCRIQQAAVCGNGATGPKASPRAHSPAPGL